MKREIVYYHLVLSHRIISSQMIIPNLNSNNKMSTNKLQRSCMRNLINPHSYKKSHPKQPIYIIIIKDKATIIL